MVKFGIGMEPEMEGDQFGPPQWYEHLVGMQMSHRGVRGILCATPDEMLYKLKKKDGVSLLLSSNHALMAKRMQLHDSQMNIEKYGQVTIRSLDMVPLERSSMDGGSCIIESISHQKSKSIPFLNVLQAEMDVLIGMSFNKTYDGNQTYQLKIVKSLTKHGERYYEVVFDDEDIDIIAKEEVLELINKLDYREKLISVEGAIKKFEEITTQCQRNENMMENQIDVRFWTQSIDIVFTQVNSEVCISELSKEIDGQAGGTGLLNVGDRIVSINGVSVELLDLNKITKIIQTSKRPILLSFLKGSKESRNNPENSTRNKKNNILWSDLMLFLRDAVSSGCHIDIYKDTITFYGKDIKKRKESIHCSTGFRKKSTNKFYDLISLVTFMKHRYHSFAQYVRRCRADEIEIISPNDMKTLVEFLNGITNCMTISGLIESKLNNSFLKLNPSLKTLENDKDMSNAIEKRKRIDQDDDDAPIKPKSKRTRDDIVTIQVKEKSLKISLIDGTKNKYPLLQAFNSKNGMGEIEASNMVLLGSELTHVNTTHVKSMKVAVVADLIRLCKRPFLITFRNQNKKN